jgi:hypothetical protein
MAVPNPSLTIRITGKVIDKSAADNTDTLEISAAYAVSSNRDIAETSHDVVLEEDHIIEFTYDDPDNTVWIGNNATIDDLFPGTRAQLRSFDASGQPVLMIPVEVYVGEPGRGLLSTVLLKFVKIFTKKAVDQVIGTEVLALATKLEEQQLGNITGLFQVSEADGKFKLNPPQVMSGSSYLLFLHGTISSTEGAFDKLLGSPAWAYITKIFGSRILALQHKTLTESPLTNVLELVKGLPQAVTLTLVSHSRGGLVGDILCRFSVVDPQQRGFSANEKEYLRKQGRTSDLAQIEAIENAMVGKTITIDRFIRVASTASGTTLLSQRLDTYFNVLVNVLGLATGLGANPIYGAAKDLIAAVLADRNDATLLPGLEVQSPKSPFNQMLNNASPDTIIESPLIVISGNAKLSVRWQAITVALTKLFYWGDNDFVVDTPSMYNGARWADNKVQYFFDAGPNVSHSNYFVNHQTQNALMAALQTTGDSLIPGFARLESRVFTPTDIRSLDALIPGGQLLPGTVSGKKPIVVLLPGIMGSTLTVNDNLVWINFLRFVGGGLISLLNSPDNNQHVRASGLVASSYKKLVDYLARDYDVLVFPFDWRLDMVINATILERKLAELQQYRQPIKLIGHSMGGVLIRDFILNFPTSWTNLKATQGFQLVFLGAPLGGSFRIPYVLYGMDSLIHTLDFIDITHSQKELLAVFSQFPGILSLLPIDTDPANDFVNPAVWAAMSEALGDTDWPVPAKNLLDAFDTYRTLVRSTTIDYGQAVYVAGQARQNQQTISGYTLDNKKLTFLATKEGDESVTWASGIPTSMSDGNRVYYATVPHGELANDPTLFGAITDLLASGLTTQLKRTPPAVRSLDKLFAARTIYNFDLSQPGIERSLMGLGTDSPFTAGESPLRISAINGDFKYAQFPLLVGHFKDDGLHNAEKAIDQYLEHELERRHRLGLYPGPIGTSEWIPSGTPLGFQGAIIVGLGQQGKLTEFQLTNTIEQVTANYLANRNSGAKTGQAGPLVLQRIGLSALLIGSSYGGLRIESVIRAIIQGVQNANTKVQRIYDLPLVVDTIEFVEIYKDRALTALKAIRAIEKDQNQSLNILCSSNKIIQRSGWRERLPVDNTSEWWTRISVSCQGSNKVLTDDERHTLRNTLLFEISTDAARVESQFLTTINETLIGMLEDFSKKDVWSPELARTIFELTIPNEFKDQVKRQNNINWILDSYTAAIPWEMLQDTVSSARPLSVNAGMIRQLATSDARVRIRPVVDSTAIVVGDPDLSNWYPQLDAAREEGEKVADLLTTQGFTVSSLLRVTAAQILQSLFSADYKIIHLAGHGVFNSDPKLPTGMVIGKEAYLTPAFINQMSNVPELVFVNCCYLGAFDAVANELSESRYRLAANIGIELIEIGVKAVIVAGWAVNDSAALAFAERFYQYLFEGDMFGEAVKKARRWVYDNWGTTNNTWGAYQAYGDPFYQLQLTRDDRQTPEVYDFVSAEEAEIELVNLLNQVESGGYDGNAITRTMDAIATAVEEADISSGRIIELQALLFAELGMYKPALANFADLWKQEQATFSFTATEKYCLTSALYQVELVKQARQKGTVAPSFLINVVAELNKVIANLDQLIQFGQTAQRSSILAATYKRLAYVSENEIDKKAAYASSSANYRIACKAITDQNTHYPLVNWLSLESALVLAGVHSWEQKKGHNRSEACKKDNTKGVYKMTCNAITINEARKKINTALQNILQLPEDQKDYSDWIAMAMLLLTKRLLGEKITDKAIRDPYVQAWQMPGFQTQHRADVEHLEFLEDALGLGNPTKTTDALSAVSKLKGTLAGLL